jgi:hypothetical protein
MSSVGLRLRNEGLITSIWREGQFMWARASHQVGRLPALAAELVRRPVVAIAAIGPPALVLQAGDFVLYQQLVTLQLHDWRWSIDG